MHEHVQIVCVIHCAAIKGRTFFFSCVSGRDSLLAIKPSLSFEQGAFKKKLQTYISTREMLTKEREK